MEQIENISIYEVRRRIIHARYPLNPQKNWTVAPGVARAK
jgi:hypothetical protein